MLPEAALTVGIGSATPVAFSSGDTLRPVASRHYGEISIRRNALHAARMVHARPQAVGAHAPMGR